MNATKLLTLGVSALLLAASAQAQVSNKTTVIFQGTVSEADIDLFLVDWAGLGVTELMRVPFINGVVVSLPEGVTSLELSADPIVQSVEDNQQGELMTEAAGEGGAGEGGAGEGGAGEGGATPFIIPLDDKPSASNRTWGILNAYNHLYDPMLYSDDYDIQNRPQLLQNAHENVKVIKVAVFDTGIDYEHPKLWIFKKGKKTQLVKNGIDLVNFTDGIPFDLNGHGTHISGTIGADEFGIAPQVKLYAVKVLDDTAGGDSATLVMGLQWALDEGVDVVNMSLGFRTDNPLVRLAVQNAYNAGLVMVAAAGNHSNWSDDGASGEGGAGEGGAGEGGASCDDTSGTGEGGAGEGGAGEGGAGGDCTGSNPYTVMYPAAYPQVIAVAAIDPLDTLASFSNDGPEIDLLAAGLNVISLDLDRGRDTKKDDAFFGLASGTSMAAPHVTGAVALMLGLAKAEGITLTPAGVRQILTDTSYNGILDLMGALEAVAALAP